MTSRHTSVIAVLWFILASPALAQPSPMQHDRMQQMQDKIHEAQAATDPATRRKLMQEHMSMMQDQMQAMQARMNSQKGMMKGKTDCPDGMSDNMGEMQGMMQQMMEHQKMMADMPAAPSAH